METAIDIAAGPRNDSSIDRLVIIFKQPLTFRYHQAQE
jgi:hypothetical protein